MYCSVSEIAPYFLFTFDFYFFRLAPIVGEWRKYSAHSTRRALRPDILLAITDAIKIFRALIHREARCAVINSNRTVIRLTLRLDEEIDDAIAARATVLLGSFHRDAVPSANSNLSSRRDCIQSTLFTSVYSRGVRDCLSRLPSQAPTLAPFA